MSFAADLVTAAAKAVKSTLFSTGGDEVNTKCYDDDEQTQADLQKMGMTLEGALNYFVGALHKVLREQHKTPVVWEGD